ncbi:hypothetical protein [uncultured Aquimarina sp.]|uniref:hypothetical protein n=1 Tax=uncultured Aquimarina sp. TaxID=575652 RepID=UPI002627F904|nr:hypothetical protein [uncultured Aquimarina sp.]
MKLEKDFNYKPIWIPANVYLEPSRRAGIHNNSKNDQIYYTSTPVKKHSHISLLTVPLPDVKYYQKSAASITKIRDFNSKSNAGRSKTSDFFQR